MATKMVLTWRVESTLAFWTLRYYGQELKSQQIQTTENNSCYYGLSLLQTPICRILEQKYK